MAAARRVLTRSGPTEINDGTFWNPCEGLPPFTVENHRAFLKGKAIVFGISIVVLGLFVFMSWAR
jgi:hypothetical protein